MFWQHHQVKVLNHFRKFPEKIHVSIEMTHFHSLQNYGQLRVSADEPQTGRGGIRARAPSTVVSGLSVDKC